MPKMAWAEITPTKPSSGDGSSENPYQIGTAAQLYWFAGLVNGTLTDGTSQKTNANAVLTKDITVNIDLLASLNKDGSIKEDGKTVDTWKPIGSNGVTYEGIFDGQGHTISGLYFNNSNTNYVGLFGYNQGTIKNVGVVDSYFCGNQNVGGVCGYNFLSGTITGCNNTGTVSGNTGVGGVCGYNNGGKITGCYNTGTVRGSGDDVGGVCGYNNEGTITGCYNSGTVSGGQYSYCVGGVCGYNNNEGTITGCYNTGTVSGDLMYVGGVCGYNYYGGTITGCYNTGTVSGSGSYVGGVCGYNTNAGTITGCYNTGTVSGNSYVGGVGGFNSGKITGCYTNDGKVNGGGGGTVTEDCGVKTNFTDGNVCRLLNTSLKDAKASVRFYQGVSYPELIMNVPTLDKDVYQINNKEELYVFALLVNKNVETSANAVLTADITVNTGVLKSDGTLAGNYSDFETWTPIGSNSVTYTGIFDGQGHTISGLYFNNSNTNYVGLFGRNQGTIKNVGVVDSYFCGNYYVGGVCGYNYGGTIIGCYNTGSVSGSSNYVGGVCGYNNGGKITGCYYDNVKCTIKGINGSDVLGQAEGKSTTQFQIGEVCYLLSQGSTVTDGENTTYYSGSVWGQQLGTDNYPVFSDYKVIKAAKGNNNTYWATFSNQSNDMDLSDLTVYTAKVSEGILTLTPCSDNIVAKGEGVLVKGNSEYLNAKARNEKIASAEANNDLVATPAEPTVINATTDHVLYRLTYNKVASKEGLGFYLSLVKDENGNVDNTSLGKKLKATPGKAYLKVAKSALGTAPIRGFVIGEDDNTTGIDVITINGIDINDSKVDDSVYDLMGRKVCKPAKGIYIKNGKKIIIK